MVDVFLESRNAASSITFLKASHLHKRWISVHHLGTFSNPFACTLHLRLRGRGGDTDPPTDKVCAAPVRSPSFLPILCAGGLDVIRKEAWSLYSTSSGDRLCWEFEEPKGPKGSLTPHHPLPQLLAVRVLPSLMPPSSVHASSLRAGKNRCSGELPPLLQLNVRCTWVTRNEEHAPPLGRSISPRRRTTVGS